MKINHIHPIYSTEESRQDIINKELEKFFMLMAARKGGYGKAVII